MDKKSMPLLYISLAFGIILILLGIILLLFFSADFEQIIFSKTSILLLILGASLLFFSIAFSHNAVCLYAGFNLCFVGITSLIFSFHLFEFSVRQFWPVYMIFSGVSLAPSGYYSYHKFRKVYIFPAFLLILLGCFFSLFSFDVIAISFSKFISRWWPIFLILFGIVLISIFLYQRQYRNSFPYLSDDDEDDVEPGDEE